MVDIERVKQGLDRCKHHDGKYCFVCPYAKENKKPFPPICNKELCSDALSVIEEQQAEIERLKPKNGKWIFTGQKNAYGGIVIECPFCEDKYAVATPLSEHFCRNCGAKLTD